LGEENSTDKTVKAMLPRSEKLEAILPRSFTSGCCASQDSWRRLDSLFYRTIRHAETAFKVNLWINIVVVAIGVILVTYSISYSAIKGLDVYSTAFGTLGVVSFIATFFLGPQKNITKNVGDLTNIQLCYRTYCAQWEAVNDFVYYRERNMTLDTLKEINSHLEILTFKTVEEIKKFKE